MRKGDEPMFKNSITKFKKLLSNENGASNVEIIVWISVVLVIATALFLFRDSIVKFIQGAMGNVNSFKLQ